MSLEERSVQMSREETEVYHMSQEEGNESRRKGSVNV